MPEKKEAKTSKNKTGCFASLSIRVKAYLLLFVCFVIAATCIGLSVMIPLVSMRDLEEKQAEIDILTMSNDIAMDLSSFRDVAYASVRDMTPELLKIETTDDIESVKRYIKSYFLKNGEWNGGMYKSGFAIYLPNRSLFDGEFHSLEGMSAVINKTGAPLGDRMRGLNPPAKEFLSKVLLTNTSWSGMADINMDSPRGYYPIYLFVTVPLTVPERSGVVAWLALFMDQRLSVSKTVKKLKYCAGAIPGNTVLVKQPIPKDYQMYALNLKTIKTGFYRTLEAADGEFRTLIHNQNGLIHEGFSSCYDETNPIYRSKRYFGTTYMANRDMAYDLPNASISYVRFDHTLQIMNETIDFITLAVIIPSAVFLIILIIVVVVYVEVGVMHQLDKAKKSLHQIVLERRAILEQYLKDDKITRNYYNFSKEKGKEGEDFNALLEEIAENAGGGGDELGILMNMSNSIGEWMEHILQDKTMHLESARKENTLYNDALALLSSWCRRSDVRFTPTYIATDVSFNKSSQLKSRFEAFTRTINLSHILGNGIALEMFKSYCKAAGHEGSLYFVLDTAWLTMMEEALHSKGGDASATDSSGSVSVSHGGVTHSQIVRLVQTIFSTYIFSPDHPVIPIGLNSSALKRLIVRADGKGRVKYSKGLFKSAAGEVRRYIDNEIIPLFKNTAQFRALFMLLNTTSQIEVSTSGETTIYSWPFVQRSNSDELKKEDEEEGHESRNYDDDDDNDDDDSDNDEEGEKKKKKKKKKVKVDDVVLRLPLGITDHDNISALVEEEKSYQLKNADASIASLPSATGQSSSRSSLPGGSQSGSRARLRAISPFAALLPGSKRKTSNADGQEGESENGGEGKKDKEWMKKSFAMTNKKTEGSDGDEQNDDE